MQFPFLEALHLKLIHRAKLFQSGDGGIEIAVFDLQAVKLAVEECAFLVAQRLTHERTPV